MREHTSTTSNSRHVATTTYTVKPGDTLFGIAQQVYGDGGKWLLIYNAYRSNLDLNTLRFPPGTVLTIPSAAQDGTGGSPDQLTV